MLLLKIYALLLLPNIITSLLDRYDALSTTTTRPTIVHLFEWKWTDIGNECETFLSNYGYGAVQVSPPMEHIVLEQNNDMPWWVRYQPVSYKLDSRSGKEADFINMVNKCNKAGVRIVVDVVFNHMTGVGAKKDAYGVSSSGGSYFDGTKGVENFPEVPYRSQHFNDKRCDRNIEGYEYSSKAESVRNCRLSGLLDLNQSNAHVRTKIVGYLNRLISIGVAGFRLDASKHMWPGDLEAIISSTNDLRQDIFGSNKRPFVVHEVIDMGGEAIKSEEYIHIGRYTDFNYGLTIARAARKEIDWSDLKWWGPGYGYGNLDDYDVLAFIDNHDNQREPKPIVLTYKNNDQYAMSVGFMLSWPYGLPRVMSSYVFDRRDQGPPNEGRQKNFETKSPVIKEDKSCDWASGWACEHRWLAIRGMVRFRNQVNDSKVDSVVTDYHRLGFARLGKGYFILNNNEFEWRKSAQTTLPGGTYCDVWSGEIVNGRCTGVTIKVKNSSWADFTVPSHQFVAIHTGAFLH